MPTLRLCAGVCLLTAFACGQNAAPNGALRVELHLDANAKSACAKVVVKGGPETRETAPMALAGQTKVVVGVLRDTMPANVSVSAVGYSDADCTVLTTPPEASAVVAAQFPAQGVEVVSLTLGPAAATDGGMDGGTDGGMDAGMDGGTDGGMDGGVDDDLDGYSPPDDCNDNDNAVHPGAPEVCADGVDNDCDLAADCAQASCNLVSCVPDGGAGAACLAMSCAETVCNDSADNDSDNAIDCADGDCNGQACGVSGTCVDAGCVQPTETGLCFDGLDNDNDSQTDCADSDCAAAMCSDGDACTLNDVCSGTSCQSGAAKVCDMPPGQCFNGAGACQPDAGGACDYAVRTGSCDDGLACLTTDTCLADGGCAGTPKTCPAPPGQCFATGACQEALDGGCTYAVTVSAGCDDGDNCTVNDTCGGDAGCTGTDVLSTCMPPGECWQTDTTCEVDGGCRFTARSGQACDGGVCTSGGTCQGSAFPYPPANFDPADIPDASIGPQTTFNSCAVTFNSTTGAFGGGGWCGQTAPTPRLVNLAMDAGTAYVIPVAGLTINSNASLTMTGTRPVILAVYGDLTSRGPIYARSQDWTTAGAGANWSGCGSSQGGNAGGVRGGGGGGFGSAGTAGAGAGGGAAGAANADVTLVPLRGGCSGGMGRRNQPPAALLANGGNGGGAVQVSATGTLQIDGIVSASGGGGRGGLDNQYDNGGGGGGSGGAILLEALSLQLTSNARLTANGGGGGGGREGGQNAGQDGADGATNSATRAAGGNGSGNAGDGASGATSTSPAGQNPATAGSSGGGAGGGGLGRIRLNASSACTIDGAALLSATVSKPSPCP